MLSVDHLPNDVEELLEHGRRVLRGPSIEETRTVPRSAWNPVSLGREVDGAPRTARRRAGEMRGSSGAGATVPSVSSGAPAERRVSLFMS